MATDDKRRIDLYDFEFPPRPVPLKPEGLKKCPDCAVEPGQPHQKGCDIERCSVCGLQRIAYCHEADHDPLFSRWTGIWPHDAEAHWIGVDLNQFLIQGFHEVVAVKPKELSDEWVCICGNVGSKDGFSACDSEGQEVEPTPEEWTSGNYVCARCKRIISDTRQVVGVAFEGVPILSRNERAAVFGSTGQRIGIWDAEKADETR